MSRLSVVGLDIGTSGVRAAAVSQGRSGGTLERFGQVALPAGTVRGGEVLDVDTVAAALSELWQKAKLPTRRVVLGLANQKVIVRQADLPWLPLAELRSSLAYQVADYIPMPVEKALLDIHPIEEFTAENGARMMRVLLVAAARDMVQASLDAVTKAGLKPVMVDLTPFAMMRAMCEVDELGLEEHSEALIDIGASVTNIVVHSGGVPRFVRILMMGGADLTEALADRLGIPFERAEHIKHTADPDGVMEEPGRSALLQAAAVLVEEIRGSLDYYLASQGASTLSRLVLSGGGARLRGIDHRLSAVTRVPVQHGSPLPGLRLGRTGLTQEQLEHVQPLATVPVGLAMGIPA